MSSNYQVWVRITNFDPKRVAKIEEAAEEVWNFGEWCQREGELIVEGESRLCSEVTESQKARELATAVMKTNGGPCQVEMSFICMEYLPYNVYDYDEDDYDKLVAVQS